MALGDGSAKKETQDIKQELNFILDAVSSIGDQLVSSFESAVDGASNLNSKVDVVGKTMQRGLVADLKKAVSNTNSLIDLQSKITRGVATQKDIIKYGDFTLKSGQKSDYYVDCRVLYCLWRVIIISSPSSFPRRAYFSQASPLGNTVARVKL